MTSPTPYQILPRLSDDEYTALRADIAEHGIRVPIDVDEAGVILDGHHRAWIAAELEVDCPRRVLTGLTVEQKREHAVAVNVHRRNLTREQRREVVSRLRSDGMSTRRIASTVGIPKTTVLRDLDHGRPASGGPFGPPVIPSVTGADGKPYPASRPTPATPTTETTQENVVVNTTTGEVIEQNEKPKPQGRKRRPLPDAFRDAAYDLTKVTERLDRLADDDRFPKNAEQVGVMVRADLLRAAEQLTTVLDRIPTKEGSR